VGTSLIAFLLATPGTLLVVALAWIYYRPILGILLLASATAITVVLIRKLQKPKPAN